MGNYTCFVEKISHVEHQKKTSIAFRKETQHL